MPHKNICHPAQAPRSRMLRVLAAMTDVGFEPVEFGTCAVNPSSSRGLGNNLFPGKQDVDDPSDRGRIAGQTNSWRYQPVCLHDITFFEQRVQYGIDRYGTHPKPELAHLLDNLHAERFAL